MAPGAEEGVKDDVWRLGYFFVFGIVYFGTGAGSSYISSSVTAAS